MPREWTAEEKQMQKMIETQAKNDPAMRERMKTHIFLEMKPMDKLPHKLYHASPKSVRTKVLKQGLKAHWLYGMVNLCETAEQCERFVRGDVWEVDTSSLDRTLFRMSDDHSRDVYDFDVWAYFGDIPKRFIKRL